MEKWPATEAMMCPIVKLAKNLLTKCSNIKHNESIQSGQNEIVPARVELVEDGLPVALKVAPGRKTTCDGDDGNHSKWMYSSSALSGFSILCVRVCVCVFGVTCRIGGNGR